METLADVMNPDCPSRGVLRRIGERWTPMIIEALSSGAMRFTALRDEVGGVTPKVLTQSLRGLEQDGLLTRTVYAQVPPRVDYELTDLGHSLLGPLRANRAWAEEHVEEILAARARWEKSA